MTEATQMTFLSIAASKRGESVNITLTEQNGSDVYTRTYPCAIDADDAVTFPNDLTERIQILCVAVCLCSKYRNTYADDARPEISRRRTVTLDQLKPKTETSTRATIAPKITGLSDSEADNSDVSLRLSSSDNGTTAVLQRGVPESSAATS